MGAQDLAKGSKRFGRAGTDQKEEHLREESLLKEACGQHDMSLQISLKVHRLWAETADSQQPCEIVSPRDTSDFEGRLSQCCCLPAHALWRLHATCVFRTIEHNLFCCSPTRAFFNTCSGVVKPVYLFFSERQLWVSMNVLQHLLACLPPQQHDEPPQAAWGKRHRQTRPLQRSTGRTWVDCFHAAVRVW